MFLENKYTKWYFNIINNAKSRSEIGYLEQHHIIPECFYINRKRKGVKGWLEGDPNSPNNLILLTAREHFICHLLLVKMTTGKAKTKMYCAFQAIMMKSANSQINSRYFSLAREYNSIAQQGQRSGKKRPEHVIEKMRPTMFKKGQVSPNKGKTMLSTTKEKLSKTKLKKATKYDIYDNEIFIGTMPIMEFCRKYGYKERNCYGSITQYGKYLHWKFLKKL